MVCFMPYTDKHEPFPHVVDERVSERERKKTSILTPTHMFNTINHFRPCMSERARWSGLYFAIGFHCVEYPDTVLMGNPPKQSIYIHNTRIKTVEYFYVGNIYIDSGIPSLNFPYNSSDACAWARQQQQQQQQKNRPKILTKIKSRKHIQLVNWNNICK